jgi:hypothetical protein
VIAVWVMFTALLLVLAAGLVRDAMREDEDR